MDWGKTRANWRDLDVVITRFENIDDFRRDEDDYVEVHFDHPEYEDGNAFAEKGTAWEVVVAEERQEKNPELVIYARIRVYRCGGGWYPDNRVLVVSDEPTNALPPFPCGDGPWEGYCTKETY